MTEKTVVQLMGYQLADVNTVLNYLGKRPFEEVVGLIDTLRKPVICNVPTETKVSTIAPPAKVMTKTKTQTPKHTHA